MSRMSHGSLPARGTMPLLYMSPKIEPGDVVLTTMPTDRHAINTVLANFGGVGSGMRRHYR